MSEYAKRFRISTNLKDVIGRDLVTRKFGAVFELVKNSIDARAKSVSIEFDLKRNKILIVDNGIGMSQKDFINKWLFVAYSEKSEIGKFEESRDYRDDIGKIRGFAGRKGIGRFSCDTLGRELNLYSKSDSGAGNISHLHIDWSDFEQNRNVEFTDIDVKINDNAKFPKLQKAGLPVDSGTVIEITGLREVWDESSIGELRTHLAKLVDPFEISRAVEIITFVVDSNGKSSHLDGPIGNNVTELLENRTARVHVVFSKESIVTELYDRGTGLFKVTESNDFQSLKDCRISANIYCLNRSAKSIFKRKMGVSTKEYGNVFLFLNGFRVMPVGEESDDTFNLGRRRKQGYVRTLGTEDLLGRVDVTAPSEKFREASSRDAGLIEDANSLELYRAVFIKAILPLERYVAGVSLSDKDDQDSGKSYGFEKDEAKLRILRIIGKLAKDPKVTFLEYDKKLVEFTNARQAESENALTDLLNIAERDNNKSLVKRIRKTKARLKELEKTEEQARSLVESREKQRREYEGKISLLEKEAESLASGQNPDAEIIKLLNHQICIHACTISSGTHLALGRADEMLEKLMEGKSINRDEFQVTFSILRHQTREICNYLSGIHLETDRIQSILRLTNHFNLNIHSHRIKGNILDFMDRYFSKEVSYSHYGPKFQFKSDCSVFNCEFSPFDISIIFENLMSNSDKAKAQNIWVEAKLLAATNQLELFVHDDGRGLDNESIDSSRIFNKHYSGDHRGTGLGLYHVRQILEEMGGSIELKPGPNQSRAEFIITLPEMAN